MDLYPAARRVLLTAYADTHAAIDAINVVDLDHYLLKPWDPPEEKLYPVIDGAAGCLARPRAIARSPHTKVIGHRWIGPVVAGARLPGPQRALLPWFMADEPKGEQLLEAAGDDGLQLPVVITEGGETLVEPTDTELADMLGSVHHPIVGDATTWSSSAAAPPVWPQPCTAHPRGCKRCSSNARPPAGRPASSSRIENYLGFPDGVSGAELTTSGAQAGREVRRRADHHPHGQSGSSQRPGPHVSSTTAAPSTRTRSSWPPASPTASCRRPAAGTTRTTPPATSSAAASTTARSCPSRRSAPAKTSTSSAARTRRVRPRCSCPARRSR